MSLIRTSTYYIEPGYVFFSRQPATLRTVVGTCVAVCLYDQVLMMGGMNHYLKPKVHDKRKATPKFGNVAIPALLRMMEEAGSRRRDIVAQILGGSAPEGVTHPSIGHQNVAMARQVLARRGVRVIGEDTGGSIGRKIIFDTGTGEIAVLRVLKLRSSDWHG